MIKNSESDSGEWEDAPLNVKTFFKVVPPVRLSVTVVGRSAAKKVDARPTSRLYISAEIFARLKLETHRVRVQLGKGSRAHQLSIIGVKDGAQECLPTRSPRAPNAEPKSYRVGFGSPDAWVGLTSPQQERPFTWETAPDGRPRLVIDLPSQLWRKHKLVGAR